MMKVDPGLVLVTYLVRFSLDIRFVYTVSNNTDNLSFLLYNKRKDISNAHLCSLCFVCLFLLFDVIFKVYMTTRLHVK
jgi:hypothetical protein